MKTIDIQDTFQIFDDPEFCGDRLFECPNLYATETSEFNCHYYSDYGSRELESIRLETEFSRSKAVKCDQCKQAWEKTKALEELPTFTEQEIFEHNINCKPVTYDPDPDGRDSKTKEGHESNAMDNSTFEQ